MLFTVRKALGKMLPPRHILLAYSCGADSTALLHALKTLQPEFSYELSCVHIHHGLRAASDTEEEFANAFAASLGVAMQVVKVNVDREGNLENAARSARYQAIEKARQAVDADIIALAHHADDQAETLLMHLISGSGMDGLQGMLEYRAPLWRPLLSVTKSDLLDYLANNNLPYMEDESNSDNRFTRNYLRHQVMPLFEKIQPGFSLRLSQTTDILSQDNTALTLMEEDWLIKNEKHLLPFHFIDLAAFDELHLSLKRRILRRLCIRHQVKLSFHQTEQLLSFIGNDDIQKLSLSKGVYAIKSQRRLHILNDDVKLISVHWSAPLKLPAGDGFGDGRHEQVLNESAQKGAVMRLPHKDDVIVPKGMHGTQPLLKYFSARGVDKAFRPYWPVYAKENRVLWVPGKGISEEAAVKPGQTEAVRLIFQDKLPDEI